MLLLIELNGITSYRVKCSCTGSLLDFPAFDLLFLNKGAYSLDVEGSVEEETKNGKNKLKNMIIALNGVREEPIAIAIVLF